MTVTSAVKNVLECLSITDILLIINSKKDQRISFRANIFFSTFPSNQALYSFNLYDLYSKQ